MHWLKRLLVVIVAIPAAIVLLFLISANYGVQGSAHYISRPPIALVSWGPPGQEIVPNGPNAAGDNGTRTAGNVVDFPVSSDTRVSIRLLFVSPERATRS